MILYVDYKVLLRLSTNIGIKHFIYPKLVTNSIPQEGTMYPYIRLRRTRNTPWLRELLAENHLSSSDLILPIFITEGHNVKEPIASLPGV
jgi:hypothetical protein